MSNHLATAAVTATLRKALQTALDTASPGLNNARVTTLRPSDPGADLPTPGVNLFLYQAAPSAPHRNLDMPTRRADGGVTQRPTAGLELHYLLTFHGDEGKLEPQILLGIVTRALHSQPVITRPMVQAMLADSTFSFLAGSDLQHAPDLVRVTPVPLSLEELSKLWSVVFQTPYVLSQAYRASVVLIDGTELPQASLRVTRTAVEVDASMGPVLDLLLSQASLAAPVRADAPTVTGGYLVLVGHDLLTEVVRVRIGNVELQPELGSAAPNLLKVQLTPAVPAGTQNVTVIHRRAIAPSPTDRHSNALQFQLRPTITASFAAGAVTVNFTPSVGQTQQVRLLLNQFDTPPGQAAKAFSFEVPLRAASAPAAQIVVPVPGVTAGKYLVRAQVDGAESLLASDPATDRFNAPLVTVP